MNFALFLQKITKETERTHLKKNEPFITGSFAIVCNWIESFFLFYN